MKVALILALAAGIAGAASWDGKHEDLTVFTVRLDGAAIGLPMPAEMPEATEIFVSSSDGAVTAFRVAIEWVDADGRHSGARVVAASVTPGGMAMAFFAGVRVDQIATVVITRLVDGKATVAAVRAVGSGRAG